MKENTITTQELDMLDKREERDKYIDRIDVLDKVKQIVMLPKLEMVTTNQVAEYYEVDTAAIRKCYQRNTAELDADGAKVEYLSRFKQIANVNGCHISFSSCGGHVLKLPDGTEIMVANRGIRCYSKRAVLRMAMLLRDSEIAKQIRTLLLDVTMAALDKATETTSIVVDERQLALDIGTAFASGDIMVFGTACTKMIDYKNKQIKALEEQNSRLTTANGKLSERNESLENSNALIAEGNVKWTSRKTISRLIRCLSKELDISYGSAWAQFYSHLYYKYGIGLRQRARAAHDMKSPYINFVRDDEWKTIESALSSLLQVNHIDPDGFYHRALPSLFAVAVR